MAVDAFARMLGMAVSQEGQAVDLSNYYTKDEIDQGTNDIDKQIQEIDEKIGDINSILATLVTPSEEEV